MQFLCDNMVINSGNQKAVEVTWPHANCKNMDGLLLSSVC